MTPPHSHPTHLTPSELGTKEYWDSAYTRELQNNAADPADQGTIWFDDSGAEEKMLLFLEELTPVPPRAAAAAVRDAQEPEEGHEQEQEGQQGDLRSCTALRVLDLGTGNGHMLFAMVYDGWEGRLVGVDYSARSVELARQIHRRRRGGAEDDESVRFVQWDMLKEDTSRILAAEQEQEKGFDIVLDKGTFDAISLGDEGIDEQGRKGCDVYPERVRELVAVGGYLLITSCNWTEEELRKWFEGNDFAHHGTINYPSFTFGGRKGQTVSSVCFRRMGNNE